MERVVQLQIEDGKLLLDESILREASLEGSVVAIVRDKSILIKPGLFTKEAQGVVEKTLSYDELEEIYAAR